MENNLFKLASLFYKMSQDPFTNKPVTPGELKPTTRPTTEQWAAVKAGVDAFVLSYFKKAENFKYDGRSLGVDLLQIPGKIEMKMPDNTPDLLKKYLLDQKLIVADTVVSARF